MSRLTQMIFGMCSIVLISTISCSGYVIVAGIAGIAKGTEDSLRQAMSRGASLDEMRTSAQANGFELTVQEAR
jgi:hypothetical protein